MELLTPELREQLLANGRQFDEDTGKSPDHMPVVKLFTPDGAATWLLTELTPGDPDLAFGLCDLGMGCPELGYVRISELQSVRGKLGLPIERDLWFKPDKTLSQYAEEASRLGYIKT